MIKIKPNGFFVMSIIVNGAPKSATTFCSELLFINLQIPHMRIATRGSLSSQIMNVEYYEFLEKHDILAQQHIAPTDYNLYFLSKFPPTLFIHLYRDPKDVIISWRHHLNRYKHKPFHSENHMAEGIISDDFHSLSDQDQLDQLIDQYFPKLCKWMNKWFSVISNLGPQFYLMEADSIVLNNVNTWTVGVKVVVA